MGIKKVILFIALAVPLSVLVSFFNPFSPRALAACAAGDKPSGSICLKPAWLTGTVGTAEVPLSSGNGMVTATINSPQDLPPLMDKCVGDHMPTRLESYAQEAYGKGDVGWELHDDKKCWWRYWTPSENKPDSTQALVRRARTLRNAGRIHGIKILSPTSWRKKRARLTMEADRS